MTASRRMGLGPCGFDFSAGERVTLLTFVRRQDLPGVQSSLSFVATGLVLVFPWMVNSAWAEAHPTGPIAFGGFGHSVVNNVGWALAHGFDIFVSVKSSRFLWLRGLCWFFLGWLIPIRAESASGGWFVASSRLGFVFLRVGISAWAKAHPTGTIAVV